MRPEDSPALTNNERSSARSALGKRIITYVVIAVIFFLLGLVPMWLNAHRVAKELEAVRPELRRSEMKNALSAAALDARRGDYEPARKAMSEFFTALSGELDRAEDSALNQTQRDAVRPLLAQRDEIITLLARSDPAAADKISDLYASYRNATGQSPTK